MNALKRYLGIFWMVLGPAAIYFLVQSAAANIDTAGKADINNPLPWIIIIAMFTPIAIGLTIFGWYCWKGAFNGSANE